jgi:hypothetical protein
MECGDREAEQTGESDHCLHELRSGERHYPGQVCCWCGDVFLPPTDATRHGPYMPRRRRRRSIRRKTTRVR